MAITKKNPRLKVFVSVDGIPLEEHTDDDQEEKYDSVTKYIEAVSGVEFTIDLELQRPWPGSSVLVDFFLDGKWIRGTFMMQKDFLEPFVKVSVAGAQHNVGKDWYTRKFCFSDLVIDDSGSRPVEDQLMKDLKQVGDIAVKAYYVENLRETDKGICQRDISGVDVVPEKALKGRSLSHQSGFKPAIKTGTTRVWDFDYVDPAKNSFAEYTFKYRSRAALQSLLIIPRDPEPVPLEERDVDTLTPAEMRELLRRQRERDEATAAVKGESGVKRERSRDRSNTADGLNDDDEISFVSAKRRRFPVTVDEDGIETIDLT